MQPMTKALPEIQIISSCFQGLILLRFMVASFFPSHKGHTCLLRSVHGGYDNTCRSSYCLLNKLSIEFFFEIIFVVYPFARLGIARQVGLVDSHKIGDTAGIVRLRATVALALRTPWLEFETSS